MTDVQQQLPVCQSCGFEVRGGFHQGEMCREIVELRRALEHEDREVEELRAALTESNDSRTVLADLIVDDEPDTPEADAAHLASRSRLSDRGRQHGFKSCEKSEPPHSCSRYEHETTTEPEASGSEHPAMQDAGGSRDADAGATGASVGGGVDGGLRRRGSVRDGRRGPTHAEPVPLDPEERFKASTIHIDPVPGSQPSCVCDGQCEWPCWQQVGLVEPGGPCCCAARLAREDGLVACNLCGAIPAAGHASIGSRRYCHEDAGDTCYTQVSRHL